MRRTFCDNCEYRTNSTGTAVLCGKSEILSDKAIEIVVRQEISGGFFEIFFFHFFVLTHICQQNESIYWHLCGVTIV